MKKFIVIFILTLLVSVNLPAHHGEEKILDRVVERSLRNYQLSVECIDILNNSR